MRDADTSLRLAASHRRGVASAALLAGLASEHGMPVAACLRGTGLRREDLADADATIDSDQELVLISNVVGELAHVPALGLIAGRRYHLTAYGPLALTAISSPTLGHAIEAGLRYLDLTFTFAPFVVESTGHGLRAAIDERSLPAGLTPEVTRFLAERDIAAVVTYIRDLIGPGRPIAQLDFRHAEPRYDDAYERLLGVRPAFGQPVTRGEITAKVLGMPLPQAEPRTAELSRRQCDQRREELRRPAPASVAETVRLRLRRDLHRGAGMATQRQVAAYLNRSERSLRRALQAEGTSFNVLATEVARTFAIGLLAGGHTAESVAKALGYSGTSAFSHAFKQWTGATPGSYPHRHIATDAPVG
jgi:AraC-like DNA-binding protein